SRRIRWIASATGCVGLIRKGGVGSSRDTLSTLRVLSRSIAASRRPFRRNGRQVGCIPATLCRSMSKGGSFQDSILRSAKARLYCGPFRVYLPTLYECSCRGCVGCYLDYIGNSQQNKRWRQGPKPPPRERPALTL